MSYRHDIFISYKWNGDVKAWVESVFVPILSNVMDELKDRFGDDDIFHDVKQTVGGASIPEVLRDGVANSKCMICVFTKNYFTNSYWCTAELSAMLRREEETDARNNEDHVGLVFPLLFIDERQELPIQRNAVYGVDAAARLLNHILPLQLDRERFFRIAAGFKGTPAYDDLRFKIYDWVFRSIYPRLMSVPDWDPQWRTTDYFVSRFDAPPPQQQPQRFTLPTL